MKKVLLTMVGAMAFMSMMATTSAYKKDGLKTPVSRTDCVTQAEMLMLGLSLDGFGLDAEEYEMLMGQDFEQFDDLAGSFTIPTCAGEIPSINGGRPGGLVDPPIDVVRPHSWQPDDETDGTSGGTSDGTSSGSPLDGMTKGYVSPGSTPSLNGGRPTKPIGPGPIDF